MAIIETPRIELEKAPYEEPRWDLIYSRNWDRLDEIYGKLIVVATLLSSSVPVEVLLWDTSKDYEFGVWRDNCQDLSWYNETLSTSIRGASKKLPAVVLIVVEADQVTIYDATDPVLPMWMVYDPGVSTWSGIAAKNGIISLSSTGTSGLWVINFAKDITYQYTTSGRRTRGQIIDRATSPAGGWDVSIPIVNDSANDVDMAVLPEAPIDQTTKIAIPAIVVATDWGVSVIIFETVWDVLDITYTIPIESASFLDNSRLALVAQSVLRVGDVPTSDEVFSGWADYSYYLTTTPAILGPVSAVVKTAFESFAIGSNYGWPYSGLTLLQEDTTTYENGMVSYTTDLFFSGIMQGDIKGAWLASSISGSIDENVSNGTFDTDITGWTETDTTTNVTSGVVTLTLTGTNGKISQTVAGLTVGKEYTLKAFGTNGTGTARVYYGALYVEPNGAESLVTFVATATAINVDLMIVGTTGNTGSFDYVSIIESVEDRSKNHNPLTVVGTGITRAEVATNAELMAYSGFSVTDYFEQAYNSDLDFGTDGFSKRIALKMAPNSAIEVLFERDSATTAQRITAQINANGTISFICDDNTTVRTATSTGVVDDSIWHIIDFHYLAGTLTIVIDSVVDGTATGTALLTLSNAAAIFRVGLDVQGANPLANGSICLLRSSASVPSSDQIIEIYELEKELFKAEAKFLLPSEDVQSLSYDEDPGLLIVGTDNGAVKYKGLIAVEYLMAGEDITSLSSVRESLLVATDTDCQAFITELGVRDEITKVPELAKKTSTQQTEIELRQKISDNPISRASFYLDTSEAESTRTTVCTVAVTRYDLVGILINKRLINFTFASNIWTYTGPSGYFDLLVSLVQKSSVISLTSHLVLHYKPVEDPEVDPWIELAMTKTGTFQKTAGEADAQAPSLGDQLLNTGDRLKIMQYTSKASVSLINTHMAGRFVQYERV